MKGQNIRYIIFTLFLSFCLIFKVNSLSYTSQEVVHIDSEFPKVCTLEDGKVLVLSSILGRQHTSVSQLDECGNVIFQNETMLKGYSAGAQLVQPSKSDKYLLAYHNKNSVAEYESKENILTFKDKNTVVKNLVTKDNLYKEKSVVALKNGNVVIAGIAPKTGFGAVTGTDINIYDPETLNAGNGLSFKAHSD